MPQNFDAIVIGSGLGGLTAAALYARSGKRVLVLERNAAFGGAATVYRHGALSIEASLHEIDGLDAADAKAPLLEALGLDSEIDFVSVGDLHEVRSPLLGEPFVLQHGFEAARESVTRRFGHARAVESYFRRLRELRDAIGMLVRHQDDRGWWLRNAMHLPEQLWPLVRERHTTVSGVLAGLFGTDEAIKLALASNLGYYTDDPDTMPFIAYAIPQASYLAGGGHYIRGGSRVLTDHLLAIVRAAGGEALSGCTVASILLDGSRLRGVTYVSATDATIREAFAPVIFGNAAPTVLATMLPAEHRDAFLAPYRQRRPSISLWTMALGLSRSSREFGFSHYSTSLLPAWLDSLSRLKEASTILGEDQSDKLPPFSIVAYDQIASGLNATPPYLVALAGIDRVENWAGLADDARRARKERWMDRIIAEIDRHFPGFAGAVTQREMSTAETMQHYLNTPQGAVYGFAPQARGFRPLAHTAVDGLYLASAFTGGGGFTGAMLGGGWAARAALARRNRSAA